MRLKLLYRLVLALTLGHLLPLSAAEAQLSQRRSAASGPEKIDVTADKLSSGNGANRIEASGNVEIKRDQTTLKANEVEVNRATQDVSAKGKVSLDDPEWKIRSADAIDFNLGRETGSIHNGDLFIEEGHISMMGRRLQKLEGQSYHVDDGFFTTCLCEPGSRPSWKFSADQMDLTLEGLGTIKNGYFYIMDVPVMYFPYAFFPLRTERQTGFLTPNFGHSTREGFRFQQPFFWAISKSTDMTVAASVESRARAGLWGEFRTIFRDQNDFRLNASYFNENLRKNERDDVVNRTIADQDIAKNRWSIIGTHRYMTAYDWLTYSDFAAYRDDLFARELVERFDLPALQEGKIRVSRFGESRMGVFRGWSDTFLRGELKFYQDFIQKDSVTLQRTPQLAFWGRRFLDTLPLEFRWRTETVNYLRRRGGDALRLDIRPEVALPYNFNSYVFGALSVAPRETLYHLYTPVKSGTRNVSRETVEMRANVATSLSRIFDWTGLGVKGVRHVIEPEVSYLFAPSIDQSRIPIMDAVDRVNRRNVLTFALANRFWGKPFTPLMAFAEDSENLSAFGTVDMRELASLKLALSYDIDRARRGGDSLTDMGIDLRFAPASFVNMTLLGGIDPGSWNISNVRTTFSLVDPRPLPKRSLDFDFNRPNMFSVTYSFLRAGPNGFLVEDANVDLDRPADCVRHTVDPRCPGASFNKNIAGSLSSTLLYHLLDNMLVYFSSTYDARDNRFIGFSAASKVLSTCECWSVTLGLRRNINPSKTTFKFDFNLLGLGASKSTLK